MQVPPEPTRINVVVSNVAFYTSLPAMHVHVSAQHDIARKKLAQIEPQEPSLSPMGYLAGEEKREIDLNGTTTDVPPRFPNMP